jgi:hypothetical protein
VANIFINANGWGADHVQYFQRAQRTDGSRRQLQLSQFFQQGVQTLAFFEGNAGFQSSPQRSSDYFSLLLKMFRGLLAHGEIVAIEVLQPTLYLFEIDVRHGVKMAQTLAGRNGNRYH